MTPDRIAIRLLERSDLPRVLDMWESLMTNGHAADPRFDRSAASRQLMERWSQDNWLLREPFPYAWVAEADGELIGWIDGFPSMISPILEQPATVRIGNLWVEPSARGRGVGRRLVETFVDAAVDAGHGFVEVGTLSLDERAVGFWKRMGFGDWRVTLAR